MSTKRWQFLNLMIFLGLLLGLGSGGSLPVRADVPPQQPGTRQVDVVFVMDTSGSMNDEFSALCSDIQLLVSDLQAEGININYTILGITASRECATDSVQSSVPGATVAHEEDWGPAMSDVSAYYPWKPGYVRLIIPMSDEGPYQGSPCEDPGPDRDSINIAILSAQRNNVRIAPILGSGHEDEPCIHHLADALAQSTGGQVFFSTTPRDDLADGVKAIIGAVANDSDGDGLPDDQDPAPGDPCQPDPQKVCFPRQICGQTNTPHWDDDGDGRADEELENGLDDDSDGLVDEDVGGVGCPFPKQICGVNNHRNFDDDGDGQKDEEDWNDQDDDGDGYIDEDIFCECPPVQARGAETPGVDDDHDFEFDEEAANGLDDDGDGCIDEDINSGPIILFPAHEHISSLGDPNIETANGIADPGVTVTLYKTYSGVEELVGTTTADENGEWRVAFSPLECGANWLQAKATLNNRDIGSSHRTLVLIRPDPPGTYLRDGEQDGGTDSTFSYVDRFLATYYYYWFDETDPNDHHTEALDRRNQDTETANWPENPFTFRYDSTDFHQKELRDMMAAGIDVVLPVYWGVPCEVGGAQSLWSNAGLESIVSAALILRDMGVETPKIAMLYDTSTVNIGSCYGEDGEMADLSTVRGQERFYLPIRDFYSIVPPLLRAEVDGRPIVWLYNTAKVTNDGPDAFEHVRRRFQDDFNGKFPYIVAEASWSAAATSADNRYKWGTSLNGMSDPWTIASLGPGYNSRHLVLIPEQFRSRENGQTYRDDWNKVMRNRNLTRIVAIETWNAIEEGNDIWHSSKYGREYIDITADYAMLFKTPTVDYAGLPIIGYPTPEFRQLAPFEDRIVQAINDRRRRDHLDALQISHGAKATAISEAQLFLYPDILSPLPLGGYEMRDSRYWFYRWDVGPVGSIISPDLLKMDQIVSRIESDIAQLEKPNRLLNAQITGIAVVCLLENRGNFGCAIVIDNRPVERHPVHPSPNNDADFGLLQTGDILVNANLIESGLEFIDWIQLLGYGGLWHHAGIYVGNNKVPEAGTDGIEIYPVEDSSFWTSDYTAIYRVKTTSDIRQAAADFAHAQVGKPYNLGFFNKGTTSRFYCSQLPWSAYWWSSDQAIDLDQDNGTPWWLDSPGMVTPDDLVFNDMVEHINGGGNYRVSNWHKYSPVDFYVTDPRGRRVGMDPRWGEPRVEIPGAVYNFDREPSFIFIPDLLDGDYTVTLIGTGTGEYTVESTVLGVTSANQSQTSGNITPDEVVHYSVNIPTDLSQPIGDIVPSGPPSTVGGGSGAGIGLLALVLAVGGVFVIVMRQRRQKTRIAPAPSAAGLATAQLTGLSGVRAGQVVSIPPSGLTIGRGTDNALHLSGDRAISRRHAVIRFARDRWFLQDQGSTAGTFVNGQRVNATTLNDGDRVQIGSTEFEFRIGTR